MFREELNYSINFYFDLLTNEKNQSDFEELTKVLAVSPILVFIVIPSVLFIGLSREAIAPRYMHIAHWCSYTLARELLAEKIICTGGL